MKKLNNLKWFSLGIVVCLIMAIMLPSAFASSLTKSAQLVYSDIKISLNGKTITPTDHYGKVVEPFTIDGTTYLPVRAISNAIGLNANWNSSTNTVELTSNPIGEDSTNSTTSSLATYSNTDVPTYTSITGRALKESQIGAYIYNYDKTECLNYQSYLLQHGYSGSEPTTTDDTVNTFYYNGKSLVGVAYASRYNEVWIVIQP